MAEDLFYVRAEVAEGLVVLDHFEERVVAEAIRARRFETNSAAANILAFGANRAARIRKRDVTHVAGCSFFKRRIG